MRYEGLDLKAWDALTKTFVQLASSCPPVETMNSAATLIGGFAAGIEIQGITVDLDDVKKRIQEGYDDFYQKKRDGKFSHVETSR